MQCNLCGKTCCTKNIKPNHIVEPKENKKPKEEDFQHNRYKNVNWSEVRSHQNGHEKNKGDARRETVAKANAFGDARMRYAIFYIDCRMGIHPSNWIK